MKTFIIGITAIVLLFLFSLAYSYQKTAVVLLAYEINALEKKKQTAVERKQKLVCDYYKNTSLGKMNQWAGNKNFTYPAHGKVVQIARKAERKTVVRSIPENGFLLAFVERFLGLDSQVEAQQDRK